MNFSAASFLFFISYVAGSIPTGFLIARWRGIQDIRAHGSGNIGATNVARALGTRYFFLVFLLDFVRAYGLLALLQWAGADQVLLIIGSCGLLLGNSYSVFLHFSGGKTIATSCGILAALHPYLLMVLFIVWAVTFVLYATVGIASVASLVALFFAAMVMNDFLSIRLFLMSMALLGIWLHRKNMRVMINSFSHTKRGI